MRFRLGVRLLPILVTAAIVALSPAIAAAHYERPTTPPDGTGHVPTYRASGAHLVVCKNDDADFAKRIAAFPAVLQDFNRELYAECLNNGYRDLQAAVDHVSGPGTTILVLPGLYQEEPSLALEPESCNHLIAPRTKLGYQILSYEQQKTCPHQQNLVGIFGVKDLQIEGTGAAPSDVIFDAQFQKLNVIRGDRTNGLYLRNFTTQRSTFNGVYVIETDGFVIDKVVGRWNNEYGFLSFAADHGLFTGCEAYGNGDSGIYPGGTSDINRGRRFDVVRYAIEVTGCRSHDNTLGYSGTGGDSVWVHDNEFDHNMGGASMDSLFPNHPGLPQNHALFEHNLIHTNNSNYYTQVRDGRVPGRSPFEASRRESSALPCRYRSGPESSSSEVTTTSSGRTGSTTTGGSASFSSVCLGWYEATTIGRLRRRRRTSTATWTTTWAATPAARAYPTASISSGTARAKGTAGKQCIRAGLNQSRFRCAPPAVSIALSPTRTSLCSSSTAPTTALRSRPYRWDAIGLTRPGGLVSSPTRSPFRALRRLSSSSQFCSSSACCFDADDVPDPWQ